MSDEQNHPKEDIVIIRTIPAPVELVWRAWTDPEYVVRWWGPRYFTAPLAEVDLREGGRFLFAMQAPEAQGGQQHYNAGEYLKVQPHTLLEFTMQLADADGNPVDPASVGMPPDFPERIHTRIEFEALRPDVTRMTITEYDWTPGQMMVYSYAGMHQSLDKMELDLSA